MRIEVGQYVTGKLLNGDGSYKTCKVVSTSHTDNIDRGLIIVIYNGIREIMLRESILKEKKE